MDDRERLLGLIGHVSKARQSLAEGAFSDTVAHARSALDVASDHIEALGLLAAAARALDDIGTEEQALTRVVAAAPFMAGAKNDLGRIKLSQGQAEVALDLFQSAIASDQSSTIFWHNVSRAYLALDRPDDAVNALIHVLVLDPGIAGAWTDLCACAREAAFMDLAAHAAENSLNVSPGNVASLWNRALLRLLLGDLTKGFDDYEMRWLQPENQAYRRHVNLLRWDGSDLSGRRIVIWTEQGLGDSMQFARYVPVIADMGGQVVLEAPRSLHPLFQSLDSRIELIEPGAEPGDVDVACPLGSLPRFIGRETPCRIPYLSVDSDRVIYWRKWLTTITGPKKRRIGLVWQGNPLGSIDRGRSIPLKLFAPIFTQDGLAIVALQKRHGLDQIQGCGFSNRLIMPPEHFDEGAGAFLDSAALLMSLDLLVTSDTSLAHLAGALGRPCMVLLKAVPDWRWQVSGSRSEWYPSMTLLRQIRHGDWESVISDLAKRLGQIT